REIKEELGINLTKFDYIGSYPGRYLYKGINYYTLCFAFKAKLEEQKIISNKEIAQIKFFSSENIPFKKIAFTEVKNALKDYLSSFQQSKSSDDRK
ncbi:NUDIX domain-containing protein, partial [Candidatus Roizmanbacteria bacterium]|nr:NUDIX domain-containing protein [Candidatus Roizmanbacteria bacterium]